MATQAQPDVPKPQDHAQLWRAEVFGGLELLRAHFVEFNFSPHTHEEFMIGVTESGTALPRFRGEVRRVGPGDVFVLHPGEVHGGGPAADSIWRYRSFYPSGSLMQQVLQELTGADRGVPQLTGDVVSDPDLATRLRQAHMVLEKPGSALAGESLLLEALASLVANYAVDKVAVSHIGAEHRAVKLAKDYLEALPSENVSLESLAQVAGLSSFRLCRVFHRETGLTPHAYQILVRVRLAKTLLVQGIPISQAAVESGFFDQAHLTKHFKRIYGVTPGRYLGKVFPDAS
ncbi:MAG: AraC family transcriptional regulator [Chloroflexi bacterium]|nr:AraC family transcriptional regulator [Chloroflexota bacterium]